ncbi:MAG: pyridoxamine 5'-phosphate oxidase [Actinomycetia bacterium]|nr:pyridoxamine 5'-phosphate oxidase [Actinomycetes bacterium]
MRAVPGSLPEPLERLAAWIEAAGEEVGAVEAYSMALATATAAGEPSLRFVLLRGLDERGLVFFSDYASQKGRELADNPRGAAAFSWPQLGRQVRASGPVTRVSREESACYFAKRPRGHRLAAWSSRQSEPVATREALAERFCGVEQRFAGRDDVPLPPYWGGYRLDPTQVEFWESGENRMHDRVRFTRSWSSGWRSELVQP